MIASKLRPSLALVALLALAPQAHAARATHAVHPPAGANLLENPGFERLLPGHAWMPAGWDTSDAGVSTVFFGRDTLLAHGGKWAVNIANTSALYPWAHNWSQTLLVDKTWWGKRATFSIWTKCNGLDGRAFVWIQAYRDTIAKMARIWGVDREDARMRMGVNKVDDPAMDLGWRSLFFEDPQTDWVRRDIDVEIPVGTNVVYVRCGLTGLGQVLFDDASLTLGPARPRPLPAAGENLLADASFENPNSPWVWMAPPFMGARIQRDSSVAHGGRQCVAFSHMDLGLVPVRVGVAQSMSAVPLRGKRLRISGWFRGDSLKGTAYVKVYAQTLHGPTQSPGTELLSGTFDWKQASAEMDVPADAIEIWAWLAFDAPCTGRVWMDDANLEIVGPASTSRAPAAPTRASAPRRKPHGKS